MTTKLDSRLKRELSIKGRPYTLTISPERLHLAPKGRRKGYELAWIDLVSGDAALATALNASLALAPPDRLREARRSHGAPATMKAKKSRKAQKKSSRTR